MNTLEAAAILGITPRGVRWAIEQNLIQADQVNGDYQIAAAEVERYRNERRPVGRPRTKRKYVRKLALDNQ